MARNFREKSVTYTPFLLNFLENKCDTFNSKPVAGVYVRGIWAKRFPNNNSDATKSGTGQPHDHLFFVFEVTAGGEAMGGLHRGARAHSRAH